jgi:probable RNA-binding protein EIF1AD
VLLDDGQEESLALLPTKFRKLIWVKRGDHLIVSGASHDFLTAAGDRGKVRFMVEHILYKDQVKHLKAQGVWYVREGLWGGGGEAGFHVFSLD